MAAEREVRLGRFTLAAAVVVCAFGASVACGASVSPSVSSNGAPNTATAFSTEPAPSSSATAVRAPTCPETWGRLEPVPAEPTEFTDGRLVPTTVPRTALLCSYLGENTGSRAGLALTRSRVLSGDLSGLPVDLAYLPEKVKGQEKACTAMAGPETDYVLAVDYPDGGRVWVSAADDPNNCVGTTNGVFDSLTSTGHLLIRVMETGRWNAPTTTTKSGDECNAPGGRSGQERQVVPDGVVDVWVCRADESSTSVAHLTDDFGDLVGAFNALPTRPTTSMCHESSFDTWTGSGKPPPPTRYDVVFGYEAGPAVRVFVIPSCDPAIDNGSLQAFDADSVIPLLERALG